MPNWCENKVKVFADSESDLLMLLRMGKPQPLDEEDEVDEHGFSMNSIHPTPPEIVDNSAIGIRNGLDRALVGDKSYPYDNWYDWRVAHWGTKWDMAEVQIDPIVPALNNKWQVTMYYQTAWSPNGDFWEYVCKKGPFEVELQYLEEGMNFIGEATITREETDLYHSEITDKMAAEAGAVLKENGEIDWEETDDLDLWGLFPLRQKVK